MTTTDSLSFASSVALSRPEIVDPNDSRIHDAAVRLHSAGFMGKCDLAKVHQSGLLSDFALLVRFGSAKHLPAVGGRAFGFVFG